MSADGSTASGGAEHFLVNTAKAGGGIASNSSATCSCSHTSSSIRNDKEPPSLSDLLSRRDFAAAASLVQLTRSSRTPKSALPKTDLWVAYCFYHSRAYEQALLLYETLSKISVRDIQYSDRISWESIKAGREPRAEAKPETHSALNETTSIGHNSPDDIAAAEATLSEMTEEEIEGLPLLIAACHFRLRQPEKGLVEIKRAPPSPKQRRLLLLLRMQQQQHQQQKTQQRHGGEAWFAIDKEIEALEGGSTEDILCAAAAHFFRCRFEKAVKLYEDLLSVHPEAFAFKVYEAICCYKMGEIDKAQSLAEDYLSVHPLSLVASNVLFCCLMERGDKQAAHALLQELGKQTGTPIEDLQTAYDPLRLNVCLFTQEEANSIPMELLSLVDSIPEARYNLAVNYLRQNRPERALALLQEVSLNISASCRAKAVKAAALLQLGQQQMKRCLLEEAESLFLEVAEEAPQTRQGSASRLESLMLAHYLKNDLEKAWGYGEQLKSIDNHQPAVWWSLMSIAVSLGREEEALDCLLHIEDESYWQDELYQQWFVRLHIKAGLHREAFRLCLQQQGNPGFPKLMLQCAVDCHVMQHYRSALEAFSIVLQLEPTENSEKGFRAAASGLVLHIACGKENGDTLPWLLQLLRSVGDPQLDEVRAAAEHLMLHFAEQKQQKIHAETEGD
ncbi:hypothetical protein, conserved [Eimeria maxima]|uniref:Intraflagellar transport protein 56 n=1 Tax=Eimeria maxima TaxID=5804 RepID=U6M4N9_EIMMA|nr:hypothetical protein, conserved [Eimeria maxima]CDJ57419.1 hypothetical protein, conserved [Eimeria maxima]